MPIQHESVLLAGFLLPLLVAIYTDVRYFMLYNWLTLPLALAGLLAALVQHRLPDALAGCALAGLITLAGCLAGGMGGGDVKLAAGIGLWLGLYRTWLVLTLAAVLGLLWGLLRLYRQGMLATWWEELRSGGWRQRHLHEDDAVPPPPGAVPFGACLAAAAWVVVLAGWNRG